MARIYADTRYELLAKPTPAEALTSLNAGVSSSGLGHRFITLAIVVLDPAAHTLTVVNAGHLPPLLRLSTGPDQPPSDQAPPDQIGTESAAPKSAPKSVAGKSKGSKRAVAIPSGPQNAAQVKPIGTDVSGLPLGIQGQTVYSQSVVPFQPGDSLVLVTDGVTEAMNPAHEIYGTPRLSAFLEHACASAAGLGEAIVADVEAFGAGEAQRDDTCVICIHRLNP